MIVLKILMGIIIWFTVVITIAIGVSAGLKTYFNSEVKKWNFRTNEISEQMES